MPQETSEKFAKLDNKRAEPTDLPQIVLKQIYFYTVKKDVDEVDGPDEWLDSRVQVVGQVKHFPGHSRNSYLTAENVVFLKIRLNSDFSPTKKLKLTLIHQFFTVNREFKKLE